MAVPPEKETIATERILRRFSLSVDDLRVANVVVVAGITAEQDGSINNGRVVDVLAAKG